MGKYILKNMIAKQILTILVFSLSLIDATQAQRLERVGNIPAESADRSMLSNFIPSEIMVENEMEVLSDDIKQIDDVLENAIESEIDNITILLRDFKQKTNVIELTVLRESVSEYDAYSILESGIDADGGAGDGGGDGGNGDGGCE